MAAQEDWALVEGRTSLTEDELEILKKSGWTVTRLATLDGCGDDALGAVIWKLQQRDEEVTIDKSRLAELVKLCAVCAQARHQTDAKRGSQDLMDAHVAHQRDLRRRTFHEIQRAEAESKIVQVGTAKRSRWPTRLSMKLHIASNDLELRELAEKQERDRWVKEIRDIVKAAKLPVAQRSSDDALLIRVAKGRRANTLRKRVKTWMKASRWLDAVFGEQWPASPECFAEFLEAMVEEPCARSFPEAVFKALMFLEYAGEVPEADQLCRAPAIKNALEEANLRLQSVELKPSRKALVIPVSIVIAWEQHVCDESKPNYHRVYAWFRLTKLWTGMRFDDTRGVPNRTLELSDTCLKGVIHRSKTSGPGKHVILLPFYISRQAWIMEKDWLEVGWKLWSSMGTTSGLATRDFMLPWPDKSCNGFVRKVVDYPIASTMSQALFNEIRTGKGEAAKPLLQPGLGVLWTEHSERVTVRTWAQAARIPEDVRRMIGRWRMRPSADEAYEQNVKVNVLRSQKVLATFIKENMANSDPFDETSVVQLVEQRMRGMGFKQEECDEQMMSLMTFMPGHDAARPCVRPKWTTTGPVVLVGDEESVVEVKTENAGLDDQSDDLQEVETDQAEVLPLEKVAGMFVVSVVGRSKTKTLHRIGDCHRQSGVHYAHFEVLGQEAPSTAAYHKACRQCFRFGVADVAATAGALGEDESSGEVTSSEMTESGGEESTGWQGNNGAFIL